MQRFILLLSFCLVTSYRGFSQHSSPPIVLSITYAQVNGHDYSELYKSRNQTITLSCERDGVFLTNKGLDGESTGLLSDVNIKNTTFSYILTAKWHYRNSYNLNPGIVEIRLMVFHSDRTFSFSFNSDGVNLFKGYALSNNMKAIEGYVARSSSLNEKTIIINNPNVKHATHSQDIISIKSIERRSSFIVVNFDYTSPYGYGGYVNISPSTYIRTSTAQYKLIDVAGIPYAPDTHTFAEIGEKLWFSLVFPAINEDIESIDIIEDNNSQSAFNFYGVDFIQSRTSTLESDNQQGKSEHRQSSTQSNTRRPKQLVKDNNFEIE